MRWPPLARRREVWVPTAAGWLLVLAVLASLAGFGIFNLYRFLAPDDPSGAPLLVVEGWMSPRELEQAADLFRRNGYLRVVTTGGPLTHWHDGQGAFADRARDFLVARGVPASAVVAVPLAETPARHRTYGSALAVKEWARRERVTVLALDVMSAGAHARRSRFLYQVAFGKAVRVGGLAAVPTDYDSTAWWSTSAGAGEVVQQFIAFVWAKTFFWPAER